MNKIVSLILCLVLLAGIALPGMAEDLVLGMAGETFTAADGTLLPYRIYAPAGQAPEGGYAVYIHLHGVGECGSDNVLQTSTAMDLVKKIIANKGQEAIVLVPQCAVGSQWVNVPFSQGVYSTNQVPMSSSLQAVMELLEQVKTRYSVDTNRLYLGGLSMGGYGVWDLLARYPGTFAAAIPVCGGADPTKAENMKDVAIRTYHSADDPTVPVSGTRAMVEALEKAGGNITYKEFTNMGHNAWNRAFTVADQLSWLFSQSRKEEEPAPSTPSQPTFDQGDVNADTLVNAKDALEVLKATVGKVTLSEDAALRADVNLDDLVNAKDALEILKYTVGKIAGFPTREPVTPTEPEIPPTLPVDEPITDTSTGKILPRLAATVYSEEPVVADIIPTLDGYVVRGDGAVDCTQGLQKALDDCRDGGGGTVFLPAGQYMITGNLKIPPRVTLAGDYNDPDGETEGYGTVIFANVPSEDTNVGGLFQLSGSSGVMGITVYYPNQDFENIKPYPAVFYTNGQGESYMLSTVQNCTVLNGYRGIGACCHTVNTNAHEQLTVVNLKGTFLYTAAEVYNQADVGTWENVVVSGRYWAGAAGDYIRPVERNALNQYTTNHSVGMMLGDLEWTEFSGLVVEHCNIGLKIVKGQRIQFAGSLYNISLNHCAIGILVEDLDPRWGMLVANSRVDNGIQNKTNGLVKIVNVTMEGNGSSGSIERTSAEDINNLTLPAGGYVSPSHTMEVARLNRTGKVDVSATLQSVLDSMAGTGGIVYVPAGTYKLNSPVTVPAGVQLRGSNAVPPRGTPGDSRGTVFLAYYGEDQGLDPLGTPALITLDGENAGVYGIRITFPANGPYDEDLSTPYAIRGKGKGVYAVNCTITAAGYGIDFTGCDNHYIRKVTTCCYYNTFRVGGKGGVISGCLQNGTVIARCGDLFLENWLNEANIFTDLFDPVLRKKAKYITVEESTNQTIMNTFVYGSHTMITAQNATDLLMVNIGCDNIGGDAYQVHLKSGTATLINGMRYNGNSYKKEEGTLRLYNRLTINKKTEQNGIY